MTSTSTIPRLTVADTTSTSLTAAPCRRRRRSATPPTPPPDPKSSTTIVPSITHTRNPVPTVRKLWTTSTRATPGRSPGTVPICMRAANVHLRVGTSTMGRSLIMGSSLGEDGPRVGMVGRASMDLDMVEGVSMGGGRIRCMRVSPSMGIPDRNMGGKTIARSLNRSMDGGLITGGRVNTVSLDRSTALGMEGGRNLKGQVRSTGLVMGGRPNLNMGDPNMEGSPNLKNTDPRAMVGSSLNTERRGLVTEDLAMRHRSMKGPAMEGLRKRITGSPATRGVMMMKMRAMVAKNMEMITLTMRRRSLATSITTASTTMNKEEAIITGSCHMLLNQVFSSFLMF